LGEAMQITEKTKCWICGRNPEELKNAIEAYWESGELRKDMSLDACFEIVSIEKFCSKKKMQIPVCIICLQVTLQYILDHLRDHLEVVVTTEQPRVSINL